MTITDIITSVDALKPNAFSASQKAAWIIEVDGRVNAEIVKDDEYIAPVYDDEEDDSDLLVPSPYASVYHLYIEAQIARHSLNYDEYNALSEIFNAAYLDYAKYYTRTNVPAQPNQIINVW